MPNYCYCSLSLEGDKKDIDAVKQKISTTDDNGKTIPIDFNQVIPMPSELKISHQSDAELLFEHHFLKKQLDKHELRMLRNMSEKHKSVALHIAKQYCDNFQKHGHITWYDWCIENWGTKWNALEVEVDANTIYFNTAWSPPIPVIKALSKSFPKLLFDLSYRDELESSSSGMCFRNGEVVDE